MFNFMVPLAVVCDDDVIDRVATWTGCGEIAVFQFLSSRRRVIAHFGAPLQNSASRLCVTRALRLCRALCDGTRSATRGSICRLKERCMTAEPIGHDADHSHRAHDSAEKLYALIDDIRICMMTTSDEEGHLYSRPMYALDPDASGHILFFTKISSPKMGEVKHDSHVNLAFSHPGKQHYVSVSGRAQIVRYRQSISEKWSEPMRTETGEYWDSPSGAVMYLYGYAKAVLTGEPPKELGETAKVNLR
jgi:general stress protein 26